MNHEEQLKRDLEFAKLRFQFFESRRAYSCDANWSIVTDWLTSQGLPVSGSNLAESFQVNHTKLVKFTDAEQEKREARIKAEKDDEAIAAELVRVEAEEKQKGEVPFSRRELLARDNQGRRTTLAAAIKKYGEVKVMSIVNSQQ
jgi:hypothetical protein